MKAFCAVRRLIPISVMCSEILSARIVCAWASVTVSPRSSRAARSSADHAASQMDRGLITAPVKVKVVLSR